MTGPPRTIATGTTKNRPPGVSPEASRQWALSGLPSLSGRSTIDYRQHDGTASNFGAAMFPVEGESTTSEKFAPDGVETRLGLQRRGVGTLNARASQPSDDGMDVDAASEASDEPMRTRSPTPTDEEMRTRSPTPSDAEMEDLSSVFDELYKKNPSPFPNQDVEMEDLSMDFSLLFGDAPSNWQQQQPQPNAEDTVTTQNASFWIENNTLDSVFGPGSPMDCEVEEEKNPMSVNNIDPITASDASIFLESSEESVKEAEKRVPIDENVEEMKRQELPKMAETTNPPSSTNAISIHRSNPPPEKSQVAIPTVTVDVSDSISTPEPSVSSKSSNNSNSEDENPSKNGHAKNNTSVVPEPTTPSNAIISLIPDSSIEVDEAALDISDLYEECQNDEVEEPMQHQQQESSNGSPFVPEESIDAEPVIHQAVVPTSANDNIIDTVSQPLTSVVVPVLPQANMSASTNDTINIIATIAQTSPPEPLSKQPVVPKQPVVQKQPKYQVTADTTPIQSARKRKAGYCSDEPLCKVRVWMNFAPIAAPEVAEAENIADEDIIQNVFDDMEEVASVAGSIASIHEEANDAFELPPLSPAYGSDSDAESYTTAQLIDIIQYGYDHADDVEDEEPWRHAELPDDDDLDYEPVTTSPVPNPPVPRLILSEDNWSTDEEVDEYEHGNVPVAIQAPPAQPFVSIGKPSDDDHSSDDEEADDRVPERENSPSPAPSVRPPTPVTPAEGSQTDEVAEPTQFDDVEIGDVPMKQVTDDDNISEAEPEHRDIPPMDDNSEAEDVDMEESDGTVQSDVETDQLVSEGSSESSEDESMEVDEPEEVPLAAPKAAKRRSRNPVDPWKAVNAVDSFVNVTLPAPNDVVVKTERSWYVQEFNALTPNMLKQEVRGDSYIAGLYNGIVVLQGSFEGVPLSSAFMSEAAVRPQVLYNDPTDPIKWMGGGRDHLVLLGDSGRLYLIGRAAEGQLGQDPSRHRYRTPTPMNMRRRVLEEMEIGRNGKPKVRSTPEILFDDVEAYDNVTIAWSNNLAFRCGTSDDGECSSTFKRYPQRDRRD